MRRIFAFLVATIDGYYEGPNQEFDWPLVDDEFAAFSVEQLDEVDTLLFGRVTYEGMAAYWPSAEAKQADPQIAERMNGLAKIVVSRSIEAADWANTRVIRDNVADEVAALKQQNSKDIAILGSSDLTARLMGLGLVDELRIMVNPVILGAGKSLFHTAEQRIHPTLVKTRVFDSGNVLLYYQL